MMCFSSRRSADQTGAVHGLAALCLFLLLAVPASAQWTNGPNAEYRIGQGSWSTWAAATSQNGLDTPTGVAVDVANGKLYVADADNNRVLRYAYPISSQQPNAERVFGQSDYTSSAKNGGAGDTTTTQSGFNGPYSLLVDNTGRLWVCDGLNYRVLWFNAAHAVSSHKPDADGVLGQADFTSGLKNRDGTDTSVAANTMNLPDGLAMDSSGRLWVADMNNNRVLRFDTPTASSPGGDADGVLGQANFTTGTQDRGDGTAEAANTMDEPSDCAVTGTALFVCDMNNRRVLRFDSAASKVDGAAADGLLGASSYTADPHTDGPSASNFYKAFGVVCDGEGRLYVTDHDHTRVTIFNDAVNKSTNADADNVIGRPNFTTYNSTPTTAQDDMFEPSQAVIDNTNGKLIVADVGNNRVTVFAASGSVPVTLSVFAAE